MVGVGLTKPVRTKSPELYVATEKQRDLLANLGYEGDMQGLAMDQASRLIDELLSGQAPTKKQRLLLRKLGVPADKLDLLNPKQAGELIDILLENLDVDRIKREVSIIDLIGQRFTVVPDSGDRYTTKEHDSLKLHYSGNDWVWYSQDGREGKYLGGTVIDWVVWDRGCTTGEAIIELWALLNSYNGNTRTNKGTPEVAKKTTIEPDAWKHPYWQDAAKKRLETVQERLWSLPDGEPGRKYLANRGIRHDMTVAFGLGYGCAWNNIAGELMPAIWIPWENKNITYITLRFLGVAKDDQSVTRISSAGFYPEPGAKKKYWGQRYLFGTQHLSPHPKEGKLKNLIFVEGELNCISIFQAIFGKHPCDVLSFGPQKNLQNVYVVSIAKKIASRYERVFVWADRPEASMDALSTLPNAIPISSPIINGNECDANDLLKQGLLNDVIAKLLY